MPLGARAGVPEAGPPVNRQGSFSVVGLRKASLPTDISPARPSPAHLGLKPGIPPLEVHFFGLEYKHPSEEVILEPSLVLSTLYASAGHQGLCHSTEQLACTPCAPGNCALCLFWVCRNASVSCEGIIRAEREEQPGAGAAALHPSWPVCAVQLIRESQLRRCACLHFTKGGNEARGGCYLSTAAQLELSLC